MSENKVAHTRERVRFAVIVICLAAAGVLTSMLLPREGVQHIISERQPIDELFNGSEAPAAIVAVIPSESLAKGTEFSCSNGGCLEKFNTFCLKQFPQLFSGEYASRESITSPLGKDELLFEPRPVCILSNGTFYSHLRRSWGNDNRMPRRLRDILHGKLKRVDFKGKNSVLHRGPEFAAHVELVAARDEVDWHPAVGFVLAAKMNHHPFHFLMDQALQLMSALHYDKTLSDHPHVGVRMSDTLLNIVKEDQNEGDHHRRLLWNISRDFASVSIKEDPRIPNKELFRVVNYEGWGSEDGRAHCFCQLAVFHGWYQRERGRFLKGDACMKLPQDEGCLAMNLARQHIAAHYQLVPYDTAVQLHDFQRVDLWKGAKTAEAPRLLVIVRQQRRFGNRTTILEMAKRIGFEVQEITMEHHPPAVQAAAARYADVIMGVHGAAFTWLSMLSTVRRENQGCRTVIELLPKVSKSLINFYVHQASVSAVTLIRVPLLRGVVDDSLEEIKKSKDMQQILRSRNPLRFMLWNMTHYYQMSDVEEALTRAMAKRQQCVI